MGGVFTPNCTGTWLAKMKVEVTTQGRRIAVFDVCDTLYFSNTTHDFIRYVVEGKRISPSLILYKALNTKYLPFLYLLVAFSKVFHTDILKKINVSMLRGSSKKELYEMAGRFVSEFLSVREVPETHQILKEKLSNGTEVYLSSSSIEPVVQAVSEKLGCAGFFSTSLAYENDIFRGELVSDLTGAKLDALKEAGLQEAVILAVSDNISDADLLRSAEVGIAVLHGGKHKDFWTSQGLRLLNVKR